MFNNEEFRNSLSLKERDAWLSIEEVIKNFLGNYRAPNYEELISKMLGELKNIGVNMSLKIHFLANHLDFFPESLGAFSDEHGERFHQDIATIEKRYKGKDYSRMLGEYCWSICRDKSQEGLSRQSKKRYFAPQK